MKPSSRWAAEEKGGKAVAIETPFIAGRYTSTYNSVALGIATQGYELQFDSEFDDIGESDAYGLTVIDGIFRGGQCFMQMEGMVFSAGFKDAFWPFGNLLLGPGVVGTLYDMNQVSTTMIGQLASAMARALVLTAVAQTPAAAVGTQTLTASQALLAKNNNGRLIYNSKLKVVPIRMRLYPSATGTQQASTQKLSFFTTT